MAKPLPHDEVYVRLGCSPIHGVGVFAVRPMSAGTNVFAADQTKISWVPATVLGDGSLDEFHRSLYHDFGIRRGDQLGCPSNFNLLTVGWYVNEPRAGEQPNLMSTAEFDLVAVRDIETGEELTINYSEFWAVTADDGFTRPR